jgi:hypothetical protein
VLKERIKSGFGCKICFHENRSKDNSYIDEKLKNTGIKRIGDYIGMNVNCEFECIEDGYRWLATPANVFTKYVNKSKPKRRLNNEEIDRRLVNRNVKRIGDMTIDRRCIFKCDICEHIWETDVYGVLRGTDCPSCKFGKVEKKIKKELENKKIKFIHHKRFDFNGRKYFVDFYFPYNNLIVEYNGKQHYEPVCFGGISKCNAIKRFEQQKVRDNELRIYCNNNDIKLIEIKHDEKFKELINKIESSLQGEFY